MCRKEYKRKFCSIRIGTGVNKPTGYKSLNKNLSNFARVSRKTLQQIGLLVTAIGPLTFTKATT